MNVSKELIKNLKNLKNRGTGAGGSQTNLNGLEFEEKTYLKEEFNDPRIRQFKNTGIRKDK
jgi:hypothetical protein